MFRRLQHRQSNHSQSNLSSAYESFGGMNMITTAAPSSTRSKNIQALFVTGMILSFLGWVWETVFSFLIRSPNDRGFLTMPFCTIYGVALIFVYLLLGTPSDMRLFGRPVFTKSALLRYPAYFLASALLATVIELFTATFFQSIFGIELWNYAFLTGESDFIAILPSFFWGAAITLFMRFLFRPIHLAVKKIKSNILSGIFWTLLIVLAADLTFNFLYLSIYGTHFEIPFFKNIDMG